MANSVDPDKRFVTNRLILTNTICTGICFLSVGLKKVNGVYAFQEMSPLT